MCTNATALVNLFATPIALENIVWTTYDIWLISFALWGGAYYYFLMVETGPYEGGWDEIFKEKSPRAATRVRKERIDKAVAKVKGGE
jgi:hypothetical protein